MASEAGAVGLVGTWHAGSEVPQPQFGVWSVQMKRVRMLYWIAGRAMIQCVTSQLGRCAAGGGVLWSSAVEQRHNLAQTGWRRQLALQHVGRTNSAAGVWLRLPVMSP